MAEARIRETETGRVAEGSGWFVLNLREASWERSAGYGVSCGLEPADARFPHFGVNVTILEPGEPKSLYHSEDTQEGFLVLAGECVAVIEGAERPLRQWDYLHCPPGTAHVLVGGDRPSCAVLAIGAPRTWTLDEMDYPADPVADHHGASVARTTNSSRRAYGERPKSPRPARAPWPLPG